MECKTCKKTFFEPEVSFDENGEIDICPFCYSENVIQHVNKIVRRY